MKLKSIVSAVVCILASGGVAQAQFTPCFADINQDQNVNVTDLLQVISVWGPCVGAPPNPNHNGPNNEDGGPPPVAYCPEDVAPIGDPDGVINVSDLLLVVSEWGTCSAPPPSNGQGYVVWCEDWANANYDRWSSQYNNDSNPCTVAGFNSTQFQSRPRSIHSQITCAGGINGVHRGYAGIRFQGESVLPTFAIPSNQGFMAPLGFVAQFKSYLSVPYVMNAQDHDLWMSVMTVTDDCSNAWHRVITLNISDTTMRLRPQHVDGIQYVLGAPQFTRDQWHLVTVYVNMAEGEMHVWQDGVKVVRAWFERPSIQACQFHWGLYGSGNNSNINYIEDDFRIIKLTAPLTDTLGHPEFPGLVSPCTWSH